MHLNPAITRGANIVAGSHLRRSAPAARGTASPEATAEIYAYVAARDLAVADAERHPSSATLSRATIANELVQNCTRPARSPYQAQSLSDTQAHREQLRCAAVQTRLTQLRHRVAHASRGAECAVAA